MKGLAQPAYAMLAAVDITDRKQIDIEREQLLAREQAARSQAERANRLKDEFLAVLSHELRSPLNPILGWTNLLQQKKLDENRTRQALATIERNAKLQAQLIDDLLDISRIMHGKLTLNTSAVNLEFVIRAASETVQLAASTKNIQINLDFPPHCIQVCGDAGRLQQVIWNLLSNAVKFTPSGGQVRILLTQREQQAEVQVTDTGKGIAPDFLPYVFEHFRQEDGATTRKFGGLGLGLAITRQVVELHGGTIRVDSPGENQGATFTVHFPLLLSAQSDSNSTDEIVTLLGLESAPLSDIQVLIVEDDFETCEFLSLLLAENGAVVTTAASASQALQALERNYFDVLLSDIGMAEMDGYMLMRHIREGSQQHNASIRAIALTAYVGEFDQQQAQAAGFQQHLAKPIDSEQLITVITELIHPS